MGLIIDVILYILKLICIVFFGVIFTIGLVTVADSVYDDSTGVHYTYYNSCMADCDKLNKEYLHTRYMGSPDEECYCMDNNESVRIW